MKFFEKLVNFFLFRTSFNRTKMKEESLTPKLTIPFFDKVCVAEFFQNRGENLVAVGLKSSVDIVQLIFDESAVGEIAFEFLHKVLFFLPLKTAPFEQLLL